MGSRALEKLLETAERCLGSGYLQRAEDAYQRAIRLDPSSGDAWLGWADVARRAGRAQDAERRLQQAAQRVPDDPGLLNARTRALRRALDRDGSRADLWHELGQCLSGVGRMDEAIEAFRCAVELRPHVIASRKMLAVSLGRRGRLAESLAEFDRCLETDPADARCHLGRATALLLAGRW